MRPRCWVFVRSRQYAPPGQCEKRCRVRWVTAGGRKFRACPSHARMAREGRALELSR